MGELLDGVTWQNLLPFTAPVMGYTDGGYAWPPEAWQAFQNRGTVEISVTGDERRPVHDCEFGAESPGLAATAAANRWQARTWTTLYSSQDNLPNVTAALRSKSLGWSDAGTWPKPGVYLHIADPSGNIPAGRWAPPVTPVAVQDEWVGPYDHSTTFGFYPLAPAPTPTPGPLPLKEETMFVAVSTGVVPAGYPPAHAKAGDVYLVAESRKYGLYEAADQVALEAQLGKRVSLSGWLLDAIPGT